MISLDYQKERFANHIATFTDLGFIKVLDYEEPGTSIYRIRFIFEEDHYRLHISGDLGELTAYNYTNMVWEDFYSDFAHNPGYFEEKICAHERALYIYDEDEARKELKMLLEDFSYEPDGIEYETPNELIDDIIECFDDRRGINQEGYEILERAVGVAWCDVADLGKTRTGIIELYLLAFKLAYEQLKGASS